MPSGGDGKPQRQLWFNQALDAIADLPEQHRPCRLAVPANVGCGLAGGSWPAYRRMLFAWAERSGIDLLICAMPSGSAGSVSGKGRGRAGGCRAK